MRREPIPASSGAAAAATSATAPLTSTAAQPSQAPRLPSPVLQNVQALRAIAVLLVVAVHVSNPYGFEAKYLAGDRLVGWGALAGQTGVDLFFVISGLIMTVTTWRLEGGRVAARRFLERRVKRIYPIYWVVTLLVLAVFLTRPELINSHSSHSPQVLQSFVLAPQAGLPLLAVGWTLTFEMYFYLLFALALLAGRARLPWILGGWGAITLVLAVAFHGSTVPTLHLLSSPLLFEFVYGVAIGYLVMTRPPWAPVALLAAGVALLAVAVGFAYTIDDVTLHDWYRALAIGPPAALIVLGAIGIERQRRLIASRRLAYVGDASYSIYLWHTVLLVAAGRVVAQLLPTGGGWHLALLVAIPLAVLVACVVLYELIERPLTALVGRRRAPAAG